ncbi:MAG TPA: PIN domain-containing protein [Actinomycetota bacterium]
MTTVVDASAFYAQADGNDPNHRAVSDALRAETGLVTTEAVATEADHLILTRLGVRVELEFLRDLSGPLFDVECLTREERGIARGIVRRYRDLELGLADASLVVLAHRHGTRRILTLDERGFRAVKPLQGGFFTILPADAE